jgi:hypothetical protein
MSMMIISMRSSINMVAFKHITTVCKLGLSYPNYLATYLFVA